MKIPKHRFRVSGNYFFALTVLIAVVGSAIIPTVEQIRAILPYFFFGALAAYMYGFNHTWRRSWEEAAIQTGLTFELYRRSRIHIVKSCKLTGYYKSREANIELLGYTPTGRRKPYTRFRLSTKTTNKFQLILSTKKNKSDFHSIPRKKDSWNPWQEFDQLNNKIIFWGKPKDVLSTIVYRKNILEALTGLGEQTSSFRLELRNNELMYYEYDLIRDEEYLRAILKFLADFLDLIEKGV